jgi:ABC-2 type transport system permease protein
LIFVLAFALTTLGVVLAAGMKSMQGFQAVLNFLMMPIFFLSGALFPLSNLPWWMTGLTRIDPAAYGIDPIRRVILGASGIPSAVTDRLALTIGGQALPVMAEVGLVLAFGFVMLGIAIWSLRRPA